MTTITTKEYIKSKAKETFKDMTTREKIITWTAGTLLTIAYMPSLPVMVAGGVAYKYRKAIKGAIGMCKIKNKLNSFIK